MAKYGIDKQFYSALADSYNAMNAVSFSDVHLSKLYKVSKNLLTTLISTNYTDFTNVDLESVRSQALMYFRIFEDSRLYNEVARMLNKVTYVPTNDADYSMFTVFSDAVVGKTGVYKEPCEIIFPENLSLTSSIFMAHEVAHMLKERNPLECRNFIQYGEVIPMLLELILVYSYDYDKLDYVISKRSNLIKNASVNFINIYTDYNNLSDPYDISCYKAALCESGNYVNSFYYTLCLFGVYLENRELIMALIREVLNGNISTKDMLVLLKNNGYDFNGLYKQGKEEYISLM